MKLHDYQRIAAAKVKIHYAEKEFEKAKRKLDEAEAELRSIEVKCDHRYPNGKWAGNDGHAYEFCNICNQIDP